MTDLSEHLRIIARDGGRLDQADRARIAEAAEQFEQMQSALIATNQALIECNAHRLAATERLLELQPRPLFEMSSGWIPVKVTT